MTEQGIRLGPLSRTNLPIDRRCGAADTPTKSHAGVGKFSNGQFSFAISRSLPRAANVGAGIGAADFITPQKILEVTALKLGLDHANVGSPELVQKENFILLGNSDLALIHR